MSRTVGVVGGGIVGLAVAREITRRFPGVDLVVFEKESEIGHHQTGRNSGVVHAGIYYPPGSLKAALCTEGRALLREFCQHHDVPYTVCGKLVIAVDDSELGRLGRLERSATANGVPGLRRVDGRSIVDIEPHAAGLSALHSPETAITDFAAVARALAADIVAVGGRIRRSSPVEQIVRVGDAIEVSAGDRPQRLSRLIVCAGAQSDRVARLVDADPSPAIVPFRGEYVDLMPDRRRLVRGLIYPVPDPRYPFLGVHFTRRVSGVVDIGPNALLALDREGYAGRFATDIDDVAAMLRWPGFWRLARDHWRAGVREVVGSMSMRAFVRSARRYVPELGISDVERSGSGIRAQAVDRDGGLVDDFRIDDHDGIVLVRNAPSPAATSSLAIARHVVDQLRLGS